MEQTRTDPRVIRTRRLLKKALIELMDEREFEQVTVQDIADRATVKRATFYLHFADKTALVQHCIHETLHELRASIADAPGDEGDFDFTVGEPHPIFVRLFHHIAENYDFYRAMLVQNRIPAFSAGLLEVIHEFVLNGINLTEPDDRNLIAHRDVTVKYVESAFLEVIVWWIERQMPYDEREMAAQLMNLSIHGPYKRTPGRRK